MPTEDGLPPEIAEDFLKQNKSALEDELTAEIAKANLDLVISWIGHADSKATFYLTIALAMLGASFTELPSLVRVCKYLAEEERWFLFIALLVVHIAFYGSAIVAAFYSTAVVKPKLVPDSKTQSWYFFQSTAQFQDIQKWREFTSGLTSAERLQHLVDQIWNNARVAVSKFKSASSADRCLRIAFCTGTISVVVTLILDELTKK
jgi:hypothetical protein